MPTRNRFLYFAFAAISSAAPADATFHLMQVEQVIGGVNGDTTAQAIQLRTRSPSQNFVSEASMYAWDANGERPIKIIDITASVPNGASGVRILIASSSFLTKTNPNAVANFPMENLIPSDYLAAGSLTFEDDFGTVYWRLSWGGSSYTGSNLGNVTNDLDGNYGPPFPGPLPSTSLQAVKFKHASTARSVNNADDYALTPGAAVFINNAGSQFTITAPPVFGDIDADGDIDLDDFAILVPCLAGPASETLPGGCGLDDFHSADLDGDLDVDLQDVAEFQAAF